MYLFSLSASIFSICTILDKHAPAAFIYVDVERSRIRAHGLEYDVMVFLALHHLARRDTSKGHEQMACVVKGGQKRGVFVNDTIVIAGRKTHDQAAGAAATDKPGQKNADIYEKMEEELRKKRPNTSSSRRSINHGYES